MKKVFLPLLNNPTLRLMFRYGIVGVFASLVHWVSAYFVFKCFSLHYLLAHCIGFFSGMLPAYCGHYFYSFKDKQRHSKRFPKFFAVSGLAFVLHEVSAYVLVDRAGLDYSSFVLPLLVVLIPVVTFLLNKFWVFSDSKPSK